MKKKLTFKKVILMVAAVFAAVLILAAVVLLAEHAKIPKLYLEGDISGMEEKTDIRNVSFEYKDGRESVSGYIEMKVQGTSSLTFEKKNYTMKFYQDEAHEEKLKLDVGWGPQYKYCMKANWIDRTHARNVVSAKLASRMQQAYQLLTEAPKNGLVDGFPIEIYSNGDFLGIYTFNIPKDDWQFNMDSDNPDHIVIGGEGWEDSNLFLAAPNFGDWEVEVGEANDETLAKMNGLFDFVMNSTDEEFKANFGEHMDLDAALNYYVFCDIAYLADNRGKNMLLATYDGKIWYPSLYDLDTSWGTNWDGKSLLDYENVLVKMDWSNLFARMEKAFPQELAQRYFELREDILSDESIMNAFRQFEAEIPTLSWLQEAARWGIGPLRKMADLPGYDISQIGEYLKAAGPRLDEKYTAMLAQ